MSMPQAAVFRIAGSGWAVAGMLCPCAMLNAG